MDKKKKILITVCIIIGVICSFCLGVFSCILYLNNKSGAEVSTTDIAPNLPTSNSIITENTALTNTTDNTQANTNNVSTQKSQETKGNNYIVLYNGYEIDKKVGIQDISDIRKNAQTEKKYNITYYNYEDGKKGKTNKGKLEETYENYGQVENVEKIAISKDYNAIPRKFKEIKNLPDKLYELADYSDVDIHSIDLNGDGKTEYIVGCKVDYEKGDIGDGEPEAYSTIMLFDSKYNKIADLVTLENGFWGNIKDEDSKVFVTLDDIEYIDIDQDGNMEIIIDVPTYEGTKISILKYNGNTVEGKINYKASVLP